MKKIIFVVLIFLALGITWYFDLTHNSVEKIDDIIGKNYITEVKSYFSTKPNYQYKININKNLNEFDGGILNKKSKLKDSIVTVYTWKYFNHKKTIWVGKTESMKYEIIDAIRYKNNVNF